MLEVLAQHASRERRCDPSCRGAGDNLESHIVAGEVVPPGLLAFGPLPEVECLDQEVEHPGGVGAGRDGSGHHDAELERLLPVPVFMRPSSRGGSLPRCLDPLIGLAAGAIAPRRVGSSHPHPLALGIRSRGRLVLLGTRVFGHPPIPFRIATGQRHYTYASSWRKVSDCLRYRGIR